MSVTNLNEARRELYYWQYNWKRKDPSNNFSSLLFQLMQKADLSNQGKFALGFEHEWKAYQEWVSYEGDQDSLFEAWGFLPWVQETEI